MGVIKTYGRKPKGGNRKDRWVGTGESLRGYGLCLGTLTQTKHKLDSIFSLITGNPRNNLEKMSDSLRRGAKMGVYAFTLVKQTGSFNPGKSQGDWSERG